MKRRHLRHLLLIGLSVALVLLIRAHVLGVYRIPSGSMAPTLLGDPQSGDRVLVDKTHFARYAPERWMLAVFLRPDADRTYVKRLVGLPGDNLLIRDGDIYNHGALLIKPDEVADRVMVRVYDEGAPLAGFGAFWCITSGRPREASGAISIVPGPDGVASFQTRDEVTDGYLDAAGKSHPGRNPVGDLELRIAFRLDPKVKALEVRLDKGWDRIVVRVAVGQDGRISLPDGSESVVAGLRADVGQNHVLTVSTVDTRLRVRLDGQELWARSCQSPRSGGALPSRLNRVEVRATGGPLEVRGLRVRRDLHFTSAGGHGIFRPAVVGPDHCFLLGDNSGESVDCRQWGPVPASGLLGKPILILWPLRRVRGL